VKQPNPKHHAPNPKQIPSTKLKISNLWASGFVWNLEFEFWDFPAGWTLSE
jgi:hypothetical protein